MVEIAMIKNAMIETSAHSQRFCVFKTSRRILVKQRRNAVTPTQSARENSKKVGGVFLNSILAPFAPLKSMIIPQTHTCIVFSKSTKRQGVSFSNTFVTKYNCSGNGVIYAQ